jgi:hypothetical protein
VSGARCASRDVDAISANGFYAASTLPERTRHKLTQAGKTAKLYPRVRGSIAWRCTNLGPGLSRTTLPMTCARSTATRGPEA